MKNFTSLEQPNLRQKLGSLSHATSQHVIDSLSVGIKNQHSKKRVLSFTWSDRNSMIYQTLGSLLISNEVVPSFWIWLRTCCGKLEKIQRTNCLKTMSLSWDFENFSVHYWVTKRPWNTGKNWGCCWVFFIVVFFHTCGDLAWMLMGWGR